MTKVSGLQQRQEAYVIEGNGVAWCGRSIHDFRHNFSEAVRFYRHADADIVLHWILPEEYRRVCRTTLHVWIPQEG